MLRHKRRHCVPLLLALGLACGRSAFEPAVNVVYVLDTVNGEALPATMVLTQFSVVSLLADSVRFGKDTRFERVRWIRMEERGSGVITTRREASTGRIIEAEGRYSLVDDICLDPGALALCVELDTARFEGESLILEGDIPPAGRKNFTAAR